MSFVARAHAQMRQLFRANMTALGIPTFVTPGETLHIDWVNATTSTPETLLDIAGKTYLDWYMLTQARGAYAALISTLTPIFTPTLGL